MISVLIPVYQTNVAQLVDDLQTQLVELDSKSEIILSDVSPKPVYEADPDSKKNNIHYFHHSRQLSRSENRNFLAQQAVNPYLLFLDADAVVSKRTFIRDYYNNLDSKMVICGGTAYGQETPAQRDLLLRWLYGQRREAISAKERNNNPHRSFSSFNFLIPADVFKENPFNSGFNRYGHEDTYFGYELENNGIPVTHIDNQLIHSGLDPTDVFLEKTREGIQALVQLSQNPDIPSDFLETIKIWNTFSKLQKYGLEGAFERIYNSIHKIIVKNLHSQHPNIRLFDFYKLGYLAKIKG